MTPDDTSTAVIIVGLFIGIGVVLIALSVHIFLTGSRWAHRRWHTTGPDGRATFAQALDCDHCMKLWRTKP